MELFNQDVAKGRELGLKTDYLPADAKASAFAGGKIKNCKLKIVAVDTASKVRYIPHYRSESEIHEENKLKFKKISNLCVI